MDFIVRLLQPIVGPLLKLQLTPPHLPEGSTLIRHVKPSDTWLTYQYLRTMFGMLQQLIAVGAACVVLVMKAKPIFIAAAVALVVVELFGLALVLVATRYDFEMRHYLLGDRSLRVSMGAMTRREVTISYANVQNIEVTQGPLERVFGFKTLAVSTAGSDTVEPGKGESLHVVKMVGLENADQLRVLILGMLKTQKDAGLGEPDADAHAHASSHALPMKRLLEVRDAAIRLRDSSRERLARNGR